MVGGIKVGHFDASYARAFFIKPKGYDAKQGIFVYSKRIDTDQPCGFCSLGAKLDQVELGCSEDAVSPVTLSSDLAAQCFDNPVLIRLAECLFKTPVRYEVSGIVLMFERTVRDVAKIGVQARMSAISI
jgi:hypothetical protein